MPLVQKDYYTWREALDLIVKHLPDEDSLENLIEALHLGGLEAWIIDAKFGGRTYVPKQCWRANDNLLFRYSASTGVACLHVGDPYIASRTVMGRLQIDKAGLDRLLQPNQQAGQTLEGSGEFQRWAQTHAQSRSAIEKHSAVQVGEIGGTPDSPRPESDSEVSRLPTGVEYSNVSPSQPAGWRNQLKIWYVDVYIPEQGTEARPPSRSDDVDAAHAAFPEWNFGRNVVWGLRQKHAPKEWKNPGAPKKAKK